MMRLNECETQFMRKCERKAGLGSLLALMINFQVSLVEVDVKCGNVQHHASFAPPKSLIAFLELEMFCVMPFQACYKSAFSARAQQASIVEVLLF